MSDYDFIKMQKKLAKYLDENRYEHTLGVMFTCASLAMVHGYDLKNANLSGFDGSFKGSLTSYLDFKKIFGESMKFY